MSGCSEEVQAKQPRSLRGPDLPDREQLIFYKFIASSPTEVEPALKAIVESAVELCGAYDAVVVLKDGDGLSSAAHHGPIPMHQVRWANDRTTVSGARDHRTVAVHVHDVTSDEGAEFPKARRCRAAMRPHRPGGSHAARRRQHRAIVLRRAEVQPFKRQTGTLLQTFANQAVIVDRQCSPFDEVQAKTPADLTEALTYQTGSGNILRVIAPHRPMSNRFSMQSLRAPARLCEADDALSR